MSVAGGLHLAFDRIREVRGRALQIFTRNQRQWSASPVTEKEAELFRLAWKEWGEFPVVTHNSYLINLASPKSEVTRRSLTALRDELVRSDALGIPFVIMHPGAHLGSGLEQGLERFAENIDQVFRAAGSANRVSILLETTSGQGTSLGSSFEEIARLINASQFSERLGVCLDTCHVFAAGYDFRTPETYKATFQAFASIIGLERLKFVHLNDSLKGLGSKVDRHTHIGKGKIGLAGFKLLMNDPRFARLPMALETPKGEDLREDKENLAILKGLIKKSVG
jgi:deoxyribonuclease-4